MKFALLLLISAISSLQVEEQSNLLETPVTRPSTHIMPEGFFPSLYNDVSTMSVKDNQINGLKEFKSFTDEPTTTVDQFVLLYHPLCKDCEQWRPFFLDMVDKLEKAGTNIKVSVINASTMKRAEIPKLGTNGFPTFFFKPKGKNSDKNMVRLNSDELLTECGCDKKVALMYFLKQKFDV